VERKLTFANSLAKAARDAPPPATTNRVDGDMGGRYESARPYVEIDTGKRPVR